MLRLAPLSDLLRARARAPLFRANVLRRSVFNSKFSIAPRPIRLSSHPFHQQMRSFASESDQGTVGIDIGPTNTCLAVMEGENVRVIENPEGYRMTPSYVAFTEDGQRLAGVAAKRQALQNPEGTLYGMSLLVGRKFDDPVVQRLAKKVSYKIVEGPKKDAWVEARGQQYSPVQVLGFLLEKIQEMAHSHFNADAKFAISTTRTSQNEDHREAMTESLKTAKFELKQYVPDPVAAALAHGLNKSKPNEKIVVYDFGGKELCVSVLNVDGLGTIEVLSSETDTGLGGDDFDNVLVDFFLSEFKTQSGGVDITNDKNAMSRVREAAERGKLELSASVNTDINLAYLAPGPKHFNYRLTRSKFEQLTAHLIQDSIPTIESALSKAGINKSEHKPIIVLSGGMCRVPKIQQVVEQFFLSAPLKGINPDEVGAIGSAMQSQFLVSQIAEGTVFETLPCSIGIEDADGLFIPIIPRGTTLPAQASRGITTVADGQTQIELKIYQGERPIAAYNQVIATLAMKGLAAARRGTSKVNVEFNISSQGVMVIEAMDFGTDLRFSLTGSAVSLTEQQLVKAQLDQLSNVATDAAAVRVAQLLQQVKVEETQSAEYLAKHVYVIPAHVQEQIKYFFECIVRAYARKEKKGWNDEIEQEFTRILAGLTAINQEIDSRLMLKDKFLWTYGRTDLISEHRRGEPEFEYH